MAKAQPTTATKELEQHPLALKFAPGTMPDDEFNAFCDDIKQRGQKQKGILFEGKILDGMHRYRACRSAGKEFQYEVYDGDDPQGLVIALNVLRRKLGATQRALAGARLNLDYGIGQDEASKRVGVSKVHINLVVQALKSNNARIIKLLEKPDLTREQLHDDLVDSGVIRPSSSVVSSAATAPTGVPPSAGTGIDAMLHGTAARNSGAADGFDDLLGGGDPESDETPELDDLLGDPPTAGGKVITFKPTSEGGMPVVGSRPSHPERRNKETPASKLAEAFRGLTEADQISFMQLTWHVQRKLLKAAGLSELGATPAELKSAPPAAKVAADAIAKAASAPSKAAKGPKAAKAAKA